MKTPVRTRLLSALLSLVMLVSLLPVSVFAAEPASGTWEKVTEAQEDWSGQYLIVYEKGSLIMDGSLSALDKEGNKVDVTITDGKIVGDYAKYAFTIAPMTGGWSIQSASGKYISGKSGSNKIITGSTPELNTITFADGNVKIASNNTTLQYNAAATNGTRFRYYKSENQQPVALYKLSTAPTRQSGIVTDLTTLQNGDKVVVFNPANKKALSSVYNGFYNTGVDVELTIDRPQEGWDGHVGFVPNYVKELNPDITKTVVMCGPPIMIKFTLGGLKELGFNETQVFTTMELRMKCAIGKCGRCNIGNKYVCKDGPVFRFDQLSELPNEY